MKKIIFIIPVFVALHFAAAQSKEGYWDTMRATRESVTLKAGEKKVIKSAELPAGTTEVVYRITVLDENQQTSSSLVSVLKSIPDPTGISQGTAGAVFLASKIAGKDKCKFAVFANPKEADAFVKTGKPDKACWLQKEPVNKDARLLPASLNCIEGQKNLYFAVESDNWLLSQKVELEIVPWVNKNLSRGWTTEAKWKLVDICERLPVAKLLVKKDAFTGYFIEMMTEKFTYNEFLSLLPAEKMQLIEVLTEKCLIKTGESKALSELYRTKAKTLFDSGKKQEAIDLIEKELINKPTVTGLDFALLAKFFLFTNQWDKAESTIMSGLKKDASELQLQLQLAHLNTIKGNVSEAKKIHKIYMNQNVSAAQTWVQQTKDDFKEFEKNGITSKNFDKILKLFPQ